MWTSWFNESDDLYQYANPLGDQVELACNANHQVQRYTDPMGRYWDYTYDDQGNLTDVVDQYGRGSHWAHDELNNLTSYTDAVGHVWTMQYNDANNPTSVTDVYAPATGLRDEPAHTQFQYYGPVEPTWNGMLDRVIDPIGVATHFEYDEYGQLALYTEGNGALELLYRYNTAGWLRNVWNEEDVGFNCSPVTAMCSRDAEGNITGCGCPHYWCKDGEPERWNDQPFGMFEAELDGMGRLVSMNNDVYYNPDNWQDWRSREVDVTYDALGRPQMRIESSTESGVEVERAFDFIPDDKLGIYTVGGPDGALMVVTLDQAGRTAMVEQEGTWAEYTYHPDGRVDTVSRSNGTSTVYTHDFENLGMGIEHYDGDVALMLGLEYVFTTNGLVSSIAESIDSGQVAITMFEHDARGRLTREERTGSEPYLATYRYDANGNRLEDSLRIGGPESPTVQTYYQYYGNRIHEYEKRISSELIEQAGYTYDDYENIRRISRYVCDGGEAWNYWTDLKYDKMGRLWRVLESERPPGGSVESVAAREFRYAGARQRYLTRQLDPATLDPIPGSDVWSDYLGDSIYGDYTLDSGTATMTQRYVPGEWQTDVQSATTSFFHTNKLGTTRMLSDNLGTAIPDTSRLYTAFGVPVTEPISPMTRYGYAGTWGYQEHDDLSILHVGARYYTPSTGRFLQRDPIGIDGGLNVYEYVGNAPVSSVDPDGLYPFGGWKQDFHPNWPKFSTNKEIVKGQLIGAGAGALACGTTVSAYFGWPYLIRFLPVRYSAHAIEQMIARKLVGTVVKNAARYGVRQAGKYPGTYKFVYDNVIVIRNWAGKVITVIRKGSSWRL